MPTKGKTWERVAQGTGITAQDVKVGDVIKYETSYIMKKRDLRSLYDKRSDDWFQEYLDKNKTQEKADDAEYYTWVRTSYAEVLSVEEKGITFSKSGENGIAPKNGHIGFLEWNEIKEVIK